MRNLIRIIITISRSLFYVGRRNRNENWNRTQYRHTKGEDKNYLVSVSVRNEMLDNMIDVITECFISITSANRVTWWNGLSVRAPGAGFVRIGFSHPGPLSPSVRVRPLSPLSFSSFVPNRCFADRSISIMLNVEVLRVFHLRETRRKLASHLLQQETARHCW